MISSTIWVFDHIVRVFQDINTYKGEKWRHFIEIDPVWRQHSVSGGSKLAVVRVSGRLTLAGAGSDGAPSNGEGSKNLTRQLSASGVGGLGVGVGEGFKGQSSGEASNCLTRHPGAPQAGLAVRGRRCALRPCLTEPPAYFLFMFATQMYSTFICTHYKETNWDKILEKFLVFIHYFYVMKVNLITKSIINTQYKLT
jgi:hypothetical protein